LPISSVSFPCISIYFIELYGIVTLLPIVLIIGVVESPVKEFLIVIVERECNLVCSLNDTILLSRRLVLHNEPVPV